MARWVRRRDRAGRVLAIANQKRGVLARYAITRGEPDRAAWGTGPDGVWSGAETGGGGWRGGGRCGGRFLARGAGAGSGRTGASRTARGPDPALRSRSARKPARTSRS